MGKPVESIQGRGTSKCSASESEISLVDAEEKENQYGCGGVGGGVITRFKYTIFNDWYFQMKTAGFR